MNRSLLPAEVVVELTGARQQSFLFSPLGRNLRSRGTVKIAGSPLPGMYLAFDFDRKVVRVLEPLSYIDTAPRIRDASGQLVVQAYVQPQHAYDKLSPADFADLAATVAGLVSGGEARYVQGKFPDNP